MDLVELANAWQHMDWGAVAQQTKLAGPPSIVALLGMGMCYRMDREQAEDRVREHLTSPTEVPGVFPINRTATAWHPGMVVVRLLELQDRLSLRAAYGRVTRAMGLYDPPFRFEVTTLPSLPYGGFIKS